jgi:hypothetical protein
LWSFFRGKHVKKLAPLATAAAVALAVLVSVAAPATASGEHATVLPPSAHAAGRSDAQWSADWWRWAYQTPVHTGAAVTHPLLTTGAVDCSIGQSGRVWFLGGIFFAGGTPPGGAVVTRSCTVPHGTFLFAPIYNAAFDNSNCDGSPQTTFTTDELRSMVAQNVDGGTSLSASVDGHRVAGIAGASNPYRVASPVFSYTAPADNLVNYLFCPFSSQTVTGAVADGTYVMVGPLSTGPHTLHWSVAGSSGPIMDVTYHLTVR